MRIALVVNNPFRDLIGLVPVAQRLRDQGATCYFVPQATRERELPALAPDAVLVDDMRPARYQLYERLMDAGIELVVLDNEGGVFSNLDWYGDSLNPNAATRHRAAAFCSWGTRLAEHAVKQDWYTKEQMHVTGHPRFDFYAPQWRNIVLPGAPDATHYKKPLVLISGRYSIANPHNDTPEDKAKRLIRLRKYSEEKAFSILASQQRGMSAMVDLVNALAAHFPAITFIYRPHPFEKLETYHNLLKLKEHPNLHLTKQGTIHGWLAIADAVIHRGCTTAIEAGMLNVPALSPRWIDTPEEIESSESVSLPCQNQQELEKAIAQLQQGTLQRPDEIKEKHQQVVHDWFYKIDGLAHQRVADIIASNTARSTKIELAPCRAIVDEMNQKPHRSLRSKLKRAVYNRKSKAKSWTESDAAFDSNSIRAILTAIASVSGGPKEDAADYPVIEACTPHDYRLPVSIKYSVAMRPQGTIPS